MPIKARKWAESRRTVKVKIEDEEIHVTYRLGAMNADLADWRVEHGGDLGALRDLTERVVASWDITDDDGNELPATRAVIEEWEIPTPVLNAIFDEIYEDVSPGKLARRSSDARSSGRS